MALKCYFQKGAKHRAVSKQLDCPQSKYPPGWDVDEGPSRPRLGLLGLESVTALVSLGASELIIPGFPSLLVFKVLENFGHHFKP